MADAAIAMASHIPSRRTRSPTCVAGLSLVVALAACEGDGRKPGVGPTTPPAHAQPPDLRALLGLESQPDIVLMSIDTLRADHLGCYGYGRDTSPNLDRFADEAVLFEHALSQAPVTAPSHMSLFTGLTPAVHRVYNHSDKYPNTALAPQIPTLAELLRAHGYLAFGIHGGGNVGPELGFGRGFESYSGKFPWYDLRSAKDPMRPLRASIERAAQEDKPLFLFLHHYVVHDPYVHGPEAERLRYLEHPVEGLPLRERDLTGDAAFANRRDRFWSNVDPGDPRHVEHIVALYDGGIRYADWVFGRIEALLREQGIWDDALVIVLSDHGEEFWEHGGTLHRRLFVETLHVPLIVKFPRARYAATRIARPVRLFDVMPTLLGAAGIAPPDGLQATSLSPLLAGTSGYDPLIPSHADHKPDVLRLQHGGFAYSNQASNGTREWLFDLRTDPAERTNLAAKRRDRLEAMRATVEMLHEADLVLMSRLDSHQGEVTVPDAEGIEQLRALGYVE